MLHRQFLLAFVGLVAAYALAAEEVAVPVQDTPLHLESDAEAEKQLEAGRKAAKAGQWREAIEAYQRVIEFAPPADAQPVLPARPDSPVHLPIQDAAARELARTLDGRGLELYREAYDEPARQLLARALAERDAALLEALARRYLASSSGDEALAALGSLAFERGDFAGARTAWQTLLDYCRQPSVPALRARLWVCLHALGRTEEADALRRDLLAHHAAEKLTVGGQEVPLADFLAAPPAVPSARADGPRDDWPALGGNAAHAAVPRSLGEVGGPLWAFEVPGALPDAAAQRRLERRGLWPPLALHATVADGRLFVASEAAVFALDAATGRLLWMYPDAPEEAPSPALAECVQAVTCSDGRAVVRLADFVAAFDAATGRLLWRQPLAEDLPALPDKPDPKQARERRGDDEPDRRRRKADDLPPRRPALLATPPVVAEGRVLLGLTVLGDEARVSLLAFDAASGRRLWKTFVCSRTISAFLGLGATPSAPAVEGGTAFFSTNLGAVAAASVATGRLRWIHRYPAVHTYLRQSFVERDWRWANEPPAVVGGQVFVAPQDAAQLLALRAESGEAAWTTPRQGATYCVALGGERLFLVGSSLAAVDPRTGKRLWATELPAPPRGRPAAAQDRLHVPTPQGLVAAATTSGALTTSRLWQEGEAPGNVLLAGGRLFVASSNCVTAFEDWAKVRPRLDARRQADPNDPAPPLALGTHEVERGNPAAAVPHFEQALRLAEAKNAPDALRRARRGLYRAYRGLGEGGDLAALGQALAHAPGANEAADTLLMMARLHERAARWEAAVDAYQAILEQHPAARCRVEGALTVSGSALATSEISRLIGLHARGIYAPHGVRARQLLEQAKTPAALEAIVRRFPNSEAAEHALLRCLDQPNAKALAPDLAALAQQLAPDAASPKLREQIAAKLAALERPAERARGPLAPRWEVHTRIAHRRLELVTFPGTPPGLLYFAASRLQYGTTFHELECRRADTGSLVWQREVDPWDRQAVLAGGLLVLASADQLEALDPRSGVPRWRAALAEQAPPPTSDGDLPPPEPLLPLRWRTEHARVVALAATPDAVVAGLAGGTIVALATASGQPLWKRPLDGRQLHTDGLFAHGGKVWACVSFPASVHVLDARTGAPQPTLRLSGLDPRLTDRPVLDAAGGRLYLVLGDREVHAVDLATARERWSRRLGFSIQDVLVSPDGRRCYVVPSSFTVSGEIVSLDPATGDVRRRRSLRTGALADAVLAPDALYVAERDTDRDLLIQALDPDHLGLRWQSVPLGLSHPTRLAVGEGVLGLAGRQPENPVAVLVDAATGRLVDDHKPDGALQVSVGFAGDLVCIGTDRGVFALGPSEADQLDRRIAALRARAAAGDRPALLPLANALYRRGEEESGLALLADALRDEALPDADYLALKDQLNTLRESLARRRPAVLITPRLAVRPNIDGTIDEPWRADCAAALDGPLHIEEIQGTAPADSRWRSPSDLSAVLYSAWDEHRFYFAIDVTDDLHRTYTGQADTWVGDGLIISVDTRNKGGYGYSFGGGDILLTLALTRKDERREDRDEDSTPEGEYRVRRKDDNSGTVYEVAIPWAYLDLRPRPGLRFGFNVTVTDDDGDRATKAVSWTPGMVLDKRRSLLIRGYTPAHFGQVELAGPPRETAAPPPP